MHKVPTSLDDADDVVEHSLVLTPKLVESHKPDVCCRSAVQRGLEHEVVCLVADGRPGIDVPGAPIDLGTHEIWGRVGGWQEASGQEHNDCAVGGKQARREVLGTRQGHADLTLRCVLAPIEGRLDLRKLRTGKLAGCRCGL